MATGFIFDVLVGRTTVLESGQWGRAVSWWRGGGIRGSFRDSENGVAEFWGGLKLGVARRERNGGVEEGGGSHCWE